MLRQAPKSKNPTWSDIHLQDFSHAKKELKELATEQNFDHYPIITSNGQIIGYAVSNNYFSAYQKQQPTPMELKSIPASQAYTEGYHNQFGFSDKRRPTDAVIIAFNQWKNRPGATLVIVSKSIFDDISRTNIEINPFTHLPTLRQKLINRQKTNADLLDDDNLMLSESFFHQVLTVNDLVDGGYLAMRRGGDIAAVPHNWGLRLKEHVHNGRADIIKDIAVGDVNNLTEKELEPVISGHEFLRVSRHDAHGKKMEERFTLISGDLAEYFQLGKSGKIIGLVDNIGFSYDFGFNAVFKSDFANTTKIRILLEEREDRTLLGRHILSSQARIIKKALFDLHKTQQTLFLVGQGFKINRIKAMPRKDTGKFSLTSDSSLGIRTTMDPKRQTLGLQLAFDRQNDMVRMAVTSTRNTTLQVNGHQFHLVPHY